jgi:hypothetical protein
MGITLVLATYAAVGLALAVIGSLTLLLVAAAFTRVFARGTYNGRLLRAVAIFPFACLAWAGAVFVFQGAVNLALLNRDVGFGEGFDCPLPNGYALRSIDGTSFTLYDRKNGSAWSGVAESAAEDVRVMQLAGRYVLGASGKRFELGRPTDALDSYFLLDTHNGERTEFKTYEGLSGAAQALNIKTNLTPISDVYYQYRFTWFDAFAGLLLLGPPLARLVLLARWVVRVRRERVSSV